MNRILTQVPVVCFRNEGRLFWQQSKIFRINHRKQRHRKEESTEELGRFHPPNLCPKEDSSPESMDFPQRTRTIDKASRQNWLVLQGIFANGEIPLSIKSRSIRGKAFPYFQSRILRGATTSGGEVPPNAPLANLGGECPVKLQ